MSGTRHPWKYTMECDLTIVHLNFFFLKNASVNVNGIILNMEDELLLLPRPKKQEVAGMAWVASALVHAPLPSRKTLLVNVTYTSFLYKIKQRKLFLHWGLCWFGMLPSKKKGTISCIISNAIAVDLTFELLFTYLLSWLTSMLNY